MTAPLATTPPESAARPESPIAVADLDASCRLPVLSLFGSALIWLSAGLLLLLISSIKLHGPGFLSSVPWLTLGRVRPAAMNALLYGFACQAALGVALWMISRLGRVRLFQPVAIVIGVKAWNLGVLLGFIGILAGASTGFEWLEMPRFVAPILFAAYAAVGGCALITFAGRRETTLYVSQWFLLAALLCFPWIYSTANLLLFFAPLRGVMQAVVDCWYRGNFLDLCLTAAGLATMFYFIPKLAGRPLYSSGLAKFAFWVIALLAGWTGLIHLIGGPVPSWMISTSIAANSVLLTGVLAVGINLYHTLGGRQGCALAFEHPVLRYIAFGAACYLVASLEGILLGTRTVSAVTRFTYVETARTLLTVLGFLGMTALGAIQYIVPRLLQSPWPSARLARLNFLCSAAGIALVFVAMTAAGLVQGFKLNNPTITPVAALKATTPFMGISTLGLLLLLVGQVALLINFGSLLAGHCAPRWKGFMNVVRGAELVNAEGKA